MALVSSASNRSIAFQHRNCAYHLWRAQWCGLVWPGWTTSDLVVPIHLNDALERAGPAIWQVFVDPKKQRALVWSLVQSLIAANSKYPESSLSSSWKGCAPGCGKFGSSSRLLHPCGPFVPVSHTPAQIHLPGREDQRVARNNVDGCVHIPVSLVDLDVLRSLQVPIPLRQHLSGVLFSMKRRALPFGSAPSQTAASIGFAWAACPGTRPPRDV